MKLTAVHSNNRIRELDISRRQDNDSAGRIERGMRARTAICSVWPLIFPVSASIRRGIRIARLNSFEK